MPGVAAPLVVPFEVSLDDARSQYAPVPNVVSVQEFNWIVPGGFVWRIHWIQLTVTTDATAIQRICGLTITDEAQQSSVQIQSFASLGANSSGVFQFFTHVASGYVTPTFIVTPMPDIVLSPGSKISVQVSPFSVGDVIGAPRRLYADWFSYGKAIRPPNLQVTRLPTPTIA